MRTIFFLLLVVSTLICFQANATVVYKITFDNAPVGPAPATYTLGPDEVKYNTTDIVNKFSNAGPGAEIVDADAFLAEPLQGGNALRVHGSGSDEGYEVLMGGAGGPGPAVPPGDLTLEFCYMTTTPDIGDPPNTSALQYLGSTEWPFGQRFQWSLRIQGGTGPGGDDKIYFWTDKGDPPDTGSWVGSTASVQANRWYHVAAVLDYNDGDSANSEIRFYVDGVLQGTDTYDASDNVYSLGCSGTGGAPTYFWTMGFNAALYTVPARDDHRGLDGAIDAVAASDEPLDPGSFVLPTTYVPPPPSAAGSIWTMYE